MRKREEMTLSFDPWSTNDICTSTISIKGLENRESTTTLWASEGQENRKGKIRNKLLYSTLIPHLIQRWGTLNTLFHCIVCTFHLPECSKRFGFYCTVRATILLISNQLLFSVHRGKYKLAFCSHYEGRHQRKFLIRRIFESRLGSARDRETTSTE